MNAIQTIVMPHLGFGAPVEMYARLCTGKETAYLTGEKITFSDRGRASFDTYFNGLSVGVWKKYCQIDDLYLHLSGKGRFIVRLGLHRIGHSSKWLSESVVDLTLDDTSVEIRDWLKLEDGILYFQLEAIGEGEFCGAKWKTRTKPQTEVKLGIVITHFNRKNWVLPAIERVSEGLLLNDFYRDRVKLVVVDNSKNITPDEAKQATIVPNLNLGGSGGFTRGLLELKSMGGFTHCLFMDDDASCEIESIRRTFSLLSYSTSTSVAIAGALLRELEPYRLFEKGALFDGFCHPLKSGLDMNKVDDLLDAELTDRTPHYGGWWFFAFPINKVQEYAFPFFVRGDDSRFSISNNFEIVTMNGIACWGDDFALKSGPLSSYLDARYHLLHAMTLQKTSFKKLRKISAHFVVKQLFSYNYSSAKACRMAIQHLMKGPEFFLNNLDTAAIRQEINSFSSSEKLIPIMRESRAIKYKTGKESILKMIIRKISLNGFLLPIIFFEKKHTLFQNKGFVGDLKAIFCESEVLYEYVPLRVGYLTHHDKKRFFTEYWTYLKTMIKFRRVYRELRLQYLKEIPNMTSEKFWNDIYSECHM